MLRGAGKVPRAGSRAGGTDRYPKGVLGAGCVSTNCRYLTAARSPLTVYQTPAGVLPGKERQDFFSPTPFWIEIAH